MTNNLIVSNGYYTSINAISILKQLNFSDNPKYLIAYFKKFNINTFNENISLTYKAWNFSDIIDFNTYLNSNKFSFKAFKNNFKDKEFKNILIPINSTTKMWYSGFKKFYPNANYIFFEEGLISYVKLILDFKLKSIICEYSCYFNNFNKSFISLVFNNLKVNNANSFNIINTKFFLEALNALKDILNISFCDLNLKHSKNVLFLPQYYYSNDKSANLKKLKEYTKIINLLIDKGYKVLVKDHPKDRHVSLGSYINAYLENTNNIVLLNSINQFPIELFLNDLNINFIFSVYSTTLISGSSSVFNLPVFTSYKMLQDRIKSFSLYPSVTCSLIKAIIPDFNNFLNYYSDNAVKYYNNYVKKYDNVLDNLTFVKLIRNFLFKV